LSGGFEMAMGISPYPNVDRVGRLDFWLLLVPCALIACYRE
jgi:hypothetical protein